MGRVVENINLSDERVIPLGGTVDLSTHGLPAHFYLLESSKSLFFLFFSNLMKIPA